MLAWISPASAENDRVVVLTSYPDDMVTLFETAFAKAHPGIAAHVVSIRYQDWLGVLCQCQGLLQHLCQRAVRL
jgi:hypothetical protein